MTPPCASYKSSISGVRQTDVRKVLITEGTKNALRNIGLGLPRIVSFRCWCQSFTAYHHCGLAHRPTDPGASAQCRKLLNVAPLAPTLLQIDSPYSLPLSPAKIRLRVTQKGRAFVYFLSYSSRGRLFPCQLPAYGNRPTGRPPACGENSLFLVGR